MTAKLITYNTRRARSLYMRVTVVSVASGMEATVEVLVHSTDPDVNMEDFWRRRGHVLEDWACDRDLCLMSAVRA